MPVIPAILPSSGGTRNIPQVPSAQPQIDSAFGSLGRGVQNLAQGIGAIAQTVQHERVADYQADEITARREADDLHGQYVSTFSGYAHGKTNPDGTSVPGWDALKYDSLDTPEGGAAKRLSKAQQEFLASPQYAAMSPRAKTLFDSRAQSTYSQLSEEAVKVDSVNSIERAKTHAQASVAASLSATDAVPLYDDASWLRTADKSASDVAVMRMGTEVLNPEDLYSNGPNPDASRLHFRGGDTSRSIFAADVQKTRESLLAARAARMVDAAKAETDLDRQDAFLTQAEAFAKEHSADEKTRAAVATSAEAIRADALRKEKLTALDALATGTAYDAAGNARREEALKWAQPKFDAAKRQEATRQATELGRAMRANSAFLSSSLEAGVWVSPSGEIQPLDLAQRRQTALDALDKGLIDISHYQSIKSKLDDVEKSGQRADYEQISADVTRAIAPDVKTVFQNGMVELSTKEKDPERTVLKYTTEEKGTRREQVLSSTASTMGFMGLPDIKQTGETREVPVVIRQKKELLARDIPQIITLLMDAKRTQGMAIWRDLDGNAVKKPVKSDFNAYKEFLLNDFTDRQTALDLDAKAAKARDAIAGARQTFGADEARVLRSVANRPALPSESNSGASPDEDNSLWP